MDFLGTKKQEIRDRMNELQPLVDEHARLERILSVFDPEPDQPEPKPEKNTAAPKRKTQRRGRAPRGRNKAKVMEAVLAHPGSTASDLAEMTGIEKQMIYNVTRAACDRGELVKTELPSGTQGYFLPTTPSPDHHSLSIGVVTTGPPHVKPDSEVAYVTQEGEGMTP